MLVIRLQRVGKKGQPSYRLAVSERRSKLTANPVEDLGSYSVKTKEAAFNKERIQHWIKMGAQPTITVHNLLVKNGVITKPKIQMTFKVPPKVEPAAVVPVAAKAEAPVEEVAPVAAE